MSPYQQHLEAIDYTAPGFGELYDGLPLWSAPSGLSRLDRVTLVDERGERALTIPMACMVAASRQIERHFA